MTMGFISGVNSRGIERKEGYCTKSGYIFLSTGVNYCKCKINKLALNRTIVSRSCLST